MLNKLRKSKLILLITIILMTTFTQNTYANIDLSEEEMNTPSDWAISDINKAKEIGLIPEAIQGNYKKSITREEFSELAVALYEGLIKKEITLLGDNPFIDTYNPKVIIANQLGIVKGKGEGIFGPDENITREQASVITYSTLQVAKPKYDYSDLYEYEFKDYNMISDWANKAVGYLYGIEVVNGNGEDLFNPKGDTSREEAIVLVKRTYDKVIAAERASRSQIDVTRGSIRKPEDPQKAKLKDLISKELGKPYRYGHAGPNAFDCSGLTSYIYGKLGINLSRSSRDQVNHGVKVAKKDLQYGDLVFFAKNGKTINHVGIYVGDGNFVHAPQAGKVVSITTLMSGYHSNTYFTARRVLGE